MLAGRDTLIQSASSTIPNYTMHTMHLPIGISNQLDMLNRDFWWGDTPDKRKIHLVNWNQVCKKKDNGGLGLKKANVQNLALLSKLSWKMINDEDSLWVHILKDKYLKNHNVLSWPRKRPASHIWRSIVRTKPIIDAGIKWHIGNGKLVGIWKDWWCGTKPLAETFPGNHENSNRKVSELIDNGVWNLGSIANIIDDKIRFVILDINISIRPNISDHPCWMGTSTGMFSTTFAYDLINKQDSDLEGWS